MFNKQNKQKRENLPELFYVAPRESMDLILKKGILTPNEVLHLIKKGELPKEVLGVSYDLDSSNFPNHVSLLENYSFTSAVAEQICFSRTSRYNDPNFMAIGYLIDPILRTHPEFINNEEVQEMGSEPYPSEVLYSKKIDPKFILRTFGVRTYRY